MFCLGTPMERVYFDKFRVERDGLEYEFPAGYLQEIKGGRSNVYGLDGKPYSHPYIFARGTIDYHPSLEDREILLCKSDFPPIFSFREFEKYIMPQDYELRPKAL